MSRPITLEDLPRLPIVQQPALSLDGEKVSFVVQRWDLEGDRYRTEIWLSPFGQAGQARPVTHGRSRDHSPCFSPDGRYLAFVSDRHPSFDKDDDSDEPKQNGLWLLDLTGGEAICLTDLPGTCSSPRWSPDGSRLAFLFQPRDPAPPPTHERIAHVLRTAGEQVPETISKAQKVDEKKDKNTTPIVRRITRLHWREDAKGVLPQARNQLWTLEMAALQEGGTAAWQAVQLGSDRLRRLTAGPYDCQEHAFSPDGTRLAFVSNRSKDPDRQSGIIDLWIVSAGSGAMGGGSKDSTRLDEPSDGIEKLTHVPTPDGPLGAPSWSPDGTRIAYLGHTEPLDLWGITNYHLWSVSVPKGGGKDSGFDARDLTPDFDRSAEAAVIADLGEMAPFVPPVWQPEHGEIAFLATMGGASGIFAVPEQGGEPHAVHLEEQAAGGLVGDRTGRRLVFSSTSVTQAPEIWTIQDRAPATRLTHVTDRWHAELDLGAPQFLPVTVEGEGHQIEAWLLKPPGFDPKKKYPMILQIHGGPAAAYGHALYFEFQWLAAQGYCILYCNPRGSQGYGFEFGAAIRKDLAAPAHRDLMAAVDLVSQRPYIDESRMAVTGGSWGGYMTNWIVTQTDRFRAAIAQRSICDFEADFGTSDFGYETEWMFGGPPWTHREVYERCSPLAYVENVRTPLLLVHSEEDWRCPPAQAESFFMALKILRREVEMVRFPGEPHGLSRSGTPSRRLARLRVLNDWFGRYLKAGAAKQQVEPVPEESAQTRG